MWSLLSCNTNRHTFSQTAARRRSEDWSFIIIIITQGPTHMFDEELGKVLMVFETFLQLSHEETVRFGREALEHTGSTLRFQPSGTNAELTLCASRRSGGCSQRQFCLFLSCRPGRPFPRSSSWSPAGSQKCQQAARLTSWKTGQTLHPITFNTELRRQGRHDFCYGHKPIKMSFWFPSSKRRGEFKDNSASLLSGTTGVCCSFRGVTLWNGSTRDRADSLLLRIIWICLPKTKSSCCPLFLKNRLKT